LTVILPLLSEEDVVLFALSSPNVKGSVFTDLVFARDQDGKPLTNAVIFSDACPLCIASGKADQCTHQADTLVSWKDPDRMAYLYQLYKSIGREDVYKAELGAVGNARETTIFPRTLYMDFLTREPFPTEDHIDAVYIGIDPAYRGACEFAVVAIGQITNGDRIGFQVCIFYYNNYCIGCFCSISLSSPPFRWPITPQIQKIDPLPC
jgi:hypothetical protein